MNEEKFDWGRFMTGVVVVVTIGFGIFTIGQESVTADIESFNAFSANEKNCYWKEQPEASIYEKDHEILSTIKIVHRDKSIDIYELLCGR